MNYLVTGCVWFVLCSHILYTNSIGHFHKAFTTASKNDENKNNMSTAKLLDESDKNQES